VYGALKSVAVLWRLIEVYYSLLLFIIISSSSSRASPDRWTTDRACKGGLEVKPPAGSRAPSQGVELSEAESFGACTSIGVDKLPRPSPLLVCGGKLVTFGKVMGKSKVSCFFTHDVII